MQALRTRFGSSDLVTAAITADGTSGGKIDAADYGGAAQYLNWYNVMTYDFFGAFDAAGPDRPALAADLVHRHPARRASTPTPRSRSSRARAYRRQAAARHRLLRPGLDRRHPGRPRRHRDRRRPGHLRAGIEDYKVLKNTLPGHRHRRGHRVRQVRQQLVELRHPGHHRRQDVATRTTRVSAALLLGALRRHRQRRADQRHQRPRLSRAPTHHPHGGEGPPPVPPRPHLSSPGRPARVLPGASSPYAARNARLKWAGSRKPQRAATCRTVRPAAAGRTDRGSRRSSRPADQGDGAPSKSRCSGVGHGGPDRPSGRAVGFTLTLPDPASSVRHDAEPLDGVEAIPDAAHGGDDRAAPGQLLPGSAARARRRYAPRNSPRIPRPR